MLVVTCNFFNRNHLEGCTPPVNYSSGCPGEANILLFRNLSFTIAILPPLKLIRLMRGLCMADTQNGC